MKVAIIGSRNLTVDIANYIPNGTTKIISGGAKGIDRLAEKYADENNIPKLIIKPEYEKYGKSAPLRRNKTIVENADIVIAIWDGKSNGTKFTIEYAKKIRKTSEIYILWRENNLMIYKRVVRQVLCTKKRAKNNQYSTLIKII